MPSKQKVFAIRPEMGSSWLMTGATVEGIKAALEGVEYKLAEDLSEKLNNLQDGEADEFEVAAIYDGSKETFEVKCQLMTLDEIKNAPEFNGW